MKKLYIYLIGFFPLTIFAQETLIFNAPNRIETTSSLLDDRNISGLAQFLFQEGISLPLPPFQSHYQQIDIHAGLRKCINLLRADSPEAIGTTLSFIRANTPSRATTEARMALGNYHFERNQYADAIKQYEKISALDVDADEESQIRFRQGYAYFIQKKFRESSAILREVQTTPNEYFYPVNYYLAMSEYFLENYERAIDGFLKVERSKKYSPYIPYYVSMIYYSQKDYDQLVKYSAPRLKDKSLHKKEEISFALGQAYYELGDYTQALPLLEKASEEGKFTSGEIYQLAFSQYKAGKYKEATENFIRVSNDKSRIGQLANYYVADCFLHLDEKKSARTAFSNASKYILNEDVQKESRFKYAKLSGELGHTEDAIDILLTFPPGSTYYRESQHMLETLFLRSKDYKQVLTRLEAIPSYSMSIQKTYQKVSYLYGVELYNKGALDESYGWFAQAIKSGSNAALNAMSIFWQGEIKHKQKDYNKSIALQSEFLTRSANLVDLPESNVKEKASYTQGYNHFQLKNFPMALRFFKEVIDGPLGKSKRMSSAESRLISDASLRAGDCQFKLNRYNEADNYYNLAIEKNALIKPYAMFQTGMIKGLQGNLQGKISLLENMISTFPNSVFADDALFQTGITYQAIGNSNNAISTLEKIPSKYASGSDKLMDALLRMGLISYNNNDIPGATKYYKRVFDYNPDATSAKEALNNLKEIYLNDLNEPESYVQFVRSLEGFNLSEFSADSLTYRSAANQFENAAYSPAEESFSTYLKEFPKGLFRISALFNRAECRSFLKQYNPAFNDYKKVIEAGNSEYYATALEKGAIIAYNSQQDFATALKYYKQLTMVANSDEQRYKAEAGAMFSGLKSGALPEALPFAEAVLSSMRSDNDEKAAANYIKSLTLYNQGKYSECIPGFDKVTKLSNSIYAAESRYLIAASHQKLGNAGIAKSLSEQAMQANSAYPYWAAKSLLLHAEILYDEKDYFNARAAAEALQENFSENTDIMREVKMLLQQIEQAENRENRLIRETDTFLLMDND